MTSRVPEAAVAIQRLPVGDPDVSLRLRIALDDRREVREAAPIAEDDIEHTQAGEQPVARRGEIAYNDVTGLLTAEHEVVLFERVEHVAVADRRLDHVEPMVGKRAPQP